MTTPLRIGNRDESGDDAAPCHGRCLPRWPSALRGPPARFHVECESSGPSQSRDLPAGFVRYVLNSGETTVLINPADAGPR